MTVRATAASFLMFMFVPLSGFEEFSLPPAEYAVIHIYIDARLPILRGNSELAQSGRRTTRGRRSEISMYSIAHESQRAGEYAPVSGRAVPVAEGSSYNRNSGHGQVRARMATHGAKNDAEVRCNLLDLGWRAPPSLPVRARQVSAGVNGCFQETRLSLSARNWDTASPLPDASPQPVGIPPMRDRSSTFAKDSLRRS